MKVKTFVRWLNARLSSEHAVNGIEDLVDGVALARLTSTLTGLTFEINVHYTLPCLAEPMPRRTRDWALR